MSSDRPVQSRDDSTRADDASHNAVHGSFSLPFDLSVPPARVFAAFSEPPLRARWFRLPAAPGTAHHELDFRVGGGEVARSTFAAAGVSERLEYRSQFLDIVPDKRIVLCYEFLLDGRRRWISLATIELAPDADGTRLRWTEQYVFLTLPDDDGSHDVAHLRGGTRLQLNALAAVVEGRTNAA